ncbi:prolyl oligopeptidase family serine peptidase [Flavobacterium sp. ZB4P13]|uniref:prolyl oligopeptidase family serine peptidase n=1 Tax=Flavobacterium sp. ZB4P13 TaxID=3401728 RepID=UPI003AADF902
MKRKQTSILAFSILLTANVFAQSKPSKAPSVPVTEDYFGTKIEDKYRNLEDLKNEQTLSWMKGQADYTNAVLNAIPGKQKLIDKLVEFDGRASSKIGAVQILEDDTYFYLKQTPQDQTGKLYTRKGLTGVEKLLFDPRKYGDGSELKYSISSFSTNKKGNLLALCMAPNGKEMNEMVIINVATSEILSDKIDKLRVGGASWLKDDNSFVYTQSSTNDVLDMAGQMNLTTKIHAIGTAVATDKTLFTKEMYPKLNILDGEMAILGYDNESDMLFLFPSSVNANLKMYAAKGSGINQGKLNWELWCDRKDQVKGFGVNKNDLYFLTSLNAPNFKVLKTNFQKPNFATAKEVISENKEMKLDAFTVTKDGLFYTRSKNGIESKLFFTDFGGKNQREIITPKKAATIVTTGKGYKFSDLWVGIAGWTMAGERYKYDVKTNTFKREELASIVAYPEFENLEVQELMVKSHDGVEVPLSLIYKKGLKKDKNTPVLFYGYGAYGSSTTPGFRASFLLWVEKGGILAVAHVRGGGELGEKWHLAGQKNTKPNTWKDVIACTEYMINEGYTNPTKTAIYSRSAGGIFVGRAITERPDLYAVAIPGVGAMNTLRAENMPSGPGNTPEFGTVKIEEECKGLIEMDAYLHLKEGVKYPATLATAGFNDPRVIVWQPAKFAAKLQDVNTSNKPTLLKIDYEAGHGSGNTKQKSFEDIADILSFALWQVGHPDFQPKN